MIQILFTFVLAFLIGLERQIRRKSIGFGSFTMVAIGSCALTVIASILFPSNVFYLIGGIISSIGFLGAGALFRTKEMAGGFTTASTLWSIAVFGIAMGLEQYLIAGTVYILILGILYTDRKIEKRGRGGHFYNLHITTKKIVDQKEIKKQLKPLILTLQSVKYNIENQETIIKYATGGNLSKITRIMLEATKNPEIKSINLD
ncbi:MAG: MgtC/SapB family protein [Candidatus Ranarchaeia archaeon]